MQYNQSSSPPPPPKLPPKLPMLGRLGQLQLLPPPEPPEQQPHLVQQNVSAATTRTTATTRRTSWYVSRTILNSSLTHEKRVCFLRFKHAAVSRCSRLLIMNKILLQFSQLGQLPCIATVSPKTLILIVMKSTILSGKVTWTWTESSKVTKIFKTREERQGDLVVCRPDWWKRKVLSRLKLSLEVTFT